MSSARIPMVIIDSNEKTRKELFELLEGVNYIEVIGDFDNLLVGYDFIMQEKPQLVVIDLAENTDLSLELIEKVSSINKNIIIFACSEKVNTDIVIKAMRCGAREFLTKPVMLEDLNNALRKARSILTIDTEKTAGEIYSVFSNKGGIGKTTIAVNLALQLNELTGKRVCLVDLNLQMGDITTFMDINPSFDIAYITSHISSLDESFLFTSLEKYKNKDVYILADPPYIEQAEEISVDDIASVLNFLKSIFSYVIVDTSSSFDIKTLTCLDMSTNIFLVSMVNLPSIRNCQRCLTLFKRLEYSEDKVKLVVNRYIEDDEITIDDVEEALDHEVYWKIPNSYFSIMSSINKGVPISETQPTAGISQNFAGLASKISGAIIYSDEDNKESGSHKNGLLALIENLKGFCLPFLKSRS
ncbi:MAG: hypothetical protein A2Y25_10545 [Candidatus Melainabacteria bacterium GWF2_37_15]|nr:MAG: hypothetical protein A2Y25_10545 [Candidatus Melainabacteria bacterium GWF2_37_15]